MATRHVHHARELLGLSPHRLMARRRGRAHRQVPASNIRAPNVMQRIESFLVALRRAGRRAILIVDADCGNGRRLIDAATRARALGFVAIDARGFDGSPARLAAAAQAADAHRDPAIGFSFALLDDSGPISLEDDEDSQADLMLANSRRPATDIVHAIDRDGILIYHR